MLRYLSPPQHTSPVRKHGRFPLLTAALLGAALCLAPHAATAAGIAAVDTQNGYAGAVLGKISEIWAPPANAGNRLVRVRISVDGMGKVTGCEPTQRSGLPALDESVCNAVRTVESFGTPPYAMPIDVHFAFWSGIPRQAPAPQGQITVTPGGQVCFTPEALQKAAAAAGKPAPSLKPSDSAGQTARAGKAQDRYDEQFHPYLNRVAKQLRRASFVPAEAPRGTYYVTVRLLVDSSGTIRQYDVVQSSGNDRIDKYVRQGVHRAGKVLPPPAGLPSPFDVTLTMVR